MSPAFPLALAIGFRTADDGPHSIESRAGGNEEAHVSLGKFEDAVAALKQRLTRNELS